MNQKLFKIAVVNSLCVLGYVALVSFVMQQGEKWFGGDDNFLMPMAFLMLFVLSAAVVGTLVFARPVMIYHSGGKKEGVQLLGYTLVCLFILTVVVLAVVSFF